MLIAPKPEPAPDARPWTPVMGAQVLFAPIDRGMMRRARRAALTSLGRSDGADTEASAAEQLEELGDALSYALIMEGAQDWRDVCEMPDGDAEGVGEPLPCTAESKALLLADPVIFQAFDAAYVIPFINRERERAAPGKDSPPSQSGTGAAAMQATDTATSPVRPSKARGAKSARTPSTSRKRTPKKASGGS